MEDLELFDEIDEEIDECYFKANELLYSIDPNLYDYEKIKIIDEVINLCPYHYAAKLLKLDILKAKSNEYELLAKECKEYLNNNDIIINEESPDGNLWYDGGRIYLQVLKNLGMKYIEEMNYSKAISNYKNMLNLDVNSKLDQELFLLMSFVLAGEFDEAIKLIKELPEDLPAHYYLVAIFSYLGDNNCEEAIKYIKKLNDENKYYLGIMSGFVQIDDEDFLFYSSSEILQPRSIEEACIYINILGPMIEKYTADFIKLIQSNDKLLMEIMPNEDDMKVMSILFALEEATEKQIVNILAGTSQKHQKLSKKFKFKYPKDKAIELIKKAFDHQYIDHIVEMDIYVLSKLGISIIEGLIENEKSGYNDEYDLLF